MHTYMIVLVGIEPIICHLTSCRSRHSSFLARNANENPSNETSQPLTTSPLTRPLHALSYSTLGWNSWGRLVASLDFGATDIVMKLSRTNGRMEGGTVWRSNSQWLPSWPPFYSENVIFWVKRGSWRGSGRGSRRGSKWGSRMGGFMFCTDPYEKAFMHVTQIHFKPQYSNTNLDEAGKACNSDFCKFGQ